MKVFGIRSIGIASLGLLLFGLNWIIKDYIELLAIIGTFFLMLGAVLGFIAIVKKEKGSMKYFTIASFLLFCFSYLGLNHFKLFVC